MEPVANSDFATPPSREGAGGFTPLMYAADGNHAGVVKLLLKRGADGAMTTTQTSEGVAAGSTALDIARLLCVDDNNIEFAETMEVLRRRCCSTCGVTSPGLCALTAGVEQHLKRCGNCPARGTRARYCSKACQRVDLVSWHRGEARHTRQAAGTEV